MGNRFPSRLRRATISDVATLAGVSKATVSKYLGDGQYYIADATGRRIDAAIEELDFQPNALARGLKRRRTQTVGVIVASVVNPVYAELIEGANQVLATAGYTLIFGSSEGSPSQESAVVRSMRSHQVDGIVMASVTMQDAEVDEMIEQGLDVVLASRHMANESIDAVVVDNLNGARQAVDHLAGHGHHRVAHIAGPQDVLPFALRLRAHADLVRGGTFDDDPALTVVAESSTHEAGSAAMHELLALDTPPSAVFVGSDGMALGALEACAERGVLVPEEVAMASFDNIWVSRLPGIELTTVDSRAREVGRKAAQQLLGRIEARVFGSGVKKAPEVQVLPTSLVRRRTCGCGS